MTTTLALLIKKNRYLTVALVTSGVLNVLILIVFLSWSLKEQPPTPYCELKPANLDEQQIAFAASGTNKDLIDELAYLSFIDLVSRLDQKRLIENGYTERDLALACLVAFHQIDLQRSLPTSMYPQQMRTFLWKDPKKSITVSIPIYPGLTQEHFDAVSKFLKTEYWPFTPQKLFSILVKKSADKTVEPHLLHTFIHTNEFWTIELLFSRSNPPVKQEEIVQVLIEGNWEMLSGFVQQQRQIHDQSDARRRKFLLDYISKESKTAASLLLKTEWEFATKKLDDKQVSILLQVLPSEEPLSQQFAEEILAKPRSNQVWSQAEKISPRKVELPIIKIEQPKQATFKKENTQQTAVKKEQQKQILKPAVKPEIRLPRPTASLPQTKKIDQLSNFSTKRQVVSFSFYTVQEGDSLWKIARKLNLSVDQIKQHNRFVEEKLKPGVVLKIPQKN